LQSSITITSCAFDPHLALLRGLGSSSMRSISTEVLLFPVASSSHHHELDEEEVYFLVNVTVMKSLSVQAHFHPQHGDGRGCDRYLYLLVLWAYCKWRTWML